MECKILDDTSILVRLDPDDEICAALRQVAQQERIELAKVQGLGAVKRVVMGVYNVTTQQYKANTVEGVFEMLSLTGTLDTMNDEPYSHLHIVIGDEQGHAYGGHLNEAVVSATAEIVLTMLPGKIDRKKSAQTGLNVWKF
ncbi:hypothetical protein SAMN05216584_103119 [Selenomonas sp. WCT3]|uniref:PPC domain-containing DNA-binding protein n=1 Tax=unclassified Selenomonas TaxID=2637378 RepID=UPI0008904FB0|nr:PPC domain-containing DNA-binding protein [Selenomonas sp.]MCR5439335.1 DNA-binding protein [Selenomonas sp.]SDG25510.1 hypothetical protein SAMN05216584_103119 [Selenomonas ruminantium]